jgi:hypothetical protein
MRFRPRNPQSQARTHPHALTTMVEVERAVLQAGEVRSAGPLWPCTAGSRALWWLMRRERAREYCAGFALILALALKCYSRYSLQAKPNSVLASEVHLGPSPVNFMSTKAPYEPPDDSVFLSHAPTQSCKLMHVNYISRHGSRHSNKLESTHALINELAVAGWVHFILM